MNWLKLYIISTMVINMIKNINVEINDTLKSITIKYDEGITINEIYNLCLQMFERYEKADVIPVDDSIEAIKFLHKIRKKKKA